MERINFLLITPLNIVLKEVDDGEFMENILNDKITSKEKHDKYGTYLFGPVNHKQMIKHTDGRNFIKNNNIFP